MGAWGEKHTQSWCKCKLTLVIQFDDILVKMNLLVFLLDLKIKIKMGNSQLLGKKELLKGSQYFETILKKKGIVLFIEISLSLNDLNHTAF